MTDQELERVATLAEELHKHYASVMGWAKAVDDRFWGDNGPYWEKLIATPCEKIREILSALKQAQGISPSAQNVESTNETREETGNTLRLDWPTLIGTWKKRLGEYEWFQTVNRDNNNLYDSNRYEGIATGTRWCIEDLAKLKGVPSLEPVASTQPQVGLEPKSSSAVGTQEKQT